MEINMKKVQSENRIWKGLRHVLLCAATVCCLGMHTLTVDAATGTVIADSAKIRSTASTSGEALAGVNKDDTLDVISQTQGTDGSTWYQVHVNGSTKGYIRSDLINVSGDVPTAAATETTSQEAGADNTQGQSTETTATVTESSAAAGTITRASVNVRKGPAATDAIVGSVKQSSEVVITGETTGSDGKLWYQVSVTSNGNEVTGFIRSDLIEVTAEVPEEEPSEEVPEEEPQEEGGDEINRAISSKILPEGADLSNYTIDEETLAAMEDGRFYLLYMLGEDGSKFYYLYDLDNHAYQRADSFNTGAVEDETTGSGGFGTTAKIIVSILAVVVVILIVIIVLLMLKLRDNEWDDDDDYDEDEEDEEDEDDEDEDGRVNSRAWRPRNFLRTPREDEDDEEDEDEEDEEEERPRRPVKRPASRPESAPQRDGRQSGALPHEGAVRRRPASEAPRGEAPRRRAEAEHGPEQRRRPAGEEPRRRPAPEAPRGEAPRRRVEEATGRGEEPKRRPAPEASRGEAPRRRAPQRTNAPVQPGAAPRKSTAPAKKSYYEEDDEFEFEFLNMDGKDEL